MWPFRPTQLDRIESRQIRMEQYLHTVGETVLTLLVSPADQAKLLEVAHVMKQKTDVLKAAIASANNGRKG